MDTEGAGIVIKRTAWARSRETRGFFRLQGSTTNQLSANLDEESAKENHLHVLQPGHRHSLISIVEANSRSLK